MILSLVGAVTISALAWLPASAAAGESVHLRLGIVGADELSSTGAGRGVRVIELFGPRSTRSGIRRGDVVLRLDGRRVRDGEELADVLDQLGDGSLSLDVLRRGEIVELRVRRDPVRRIHRDVIRDVVRNVRRDVIRDVLRDVRRDVIRDVHRSRRVAVLGGERARIERAVERLRREVRDLERLLEDEGWR
jgi:hypothetical protein